MFLGDANLAMRLEMSVNHKPVWYNEQVWLACSVYDIQYASWDGHLNLIHTPATKRTHPLISIDISEEHHKAGRNMILEINAIQDYEQPDIPVFTHMSPLEVIRLSRAPIPQRLDIYWKVWHDVSTLEMSTVSSEEGISTDSIARKKTNKDPNYLDDIWDTWGLTSMTK